jgi:Autotransporter beta-domain
LGNDLGIAGTGDPNAPFPEGVLLGAGVPLGSAGGFNVLRDVFYRRDIDFSTVGFEAEFGPWRYGAFAPERLGGLRVTPHVGLTYSHWEVDEVTRFRIPRFLTDGAYNSSYVNDAFTAYAGARFDVPFRVSPNVLVIPFLKGSAGATFNRLEGDDWLNLSGFINTQQWVGVSAEHTGLFLQLRGGVNVAVNNFCLGASVTYTSDENYASFVRTGLTGQTTQAQFTDSEAFVGRITARWAFGAPAQPLTDTAAFATCP